MTSLDSESGLLERSKQQSAGQIQEWKLGASVQCWPRVLLTFWLESLEQAPALRGISRKKRWSRPDSHATYYRGGDATAPASSRFPGAKQDKSPQTGDLMRRPRSPRDVSDRLADQAVGAAPAELIHKTATATEGSDRRAGPTPPNTSCRGAPSVTRASPPTAI